MLKHIAVKVNLSQDDEASAIFSNLKKMIESFNEKTRVLTIGFSRDFSSENLNEFFKFYISKKFIEEKQIKTSFLGKWYDLSNELVEEIKELQDLSGDYDNFFLNFVLNYNGQEEILDSCKIILRKALANKFDVDSLNLEDIKDNLYNSYFPPPEKIIISGKDNRTHGFLLWDSIDSEIIFTSKKSEEFNKEKFEEVIKS